MFRAVAIQLLSYKLRYEGDCINLTTGKKVFTSVEDKEKFLQDLSNVDLVIGYEPGQYPDDEKFININVRFSYKGFNYCVTVLTLTASADMELSLSEFIKSYVPEVVAQTK